MGEWCWWGWRARWFKDLITWPQSNGVVIKGPRQVSGMMYLLWANQKNGLPFEMLCWLLGMPGKPWTLQLWGNIRDLSLALLSVIQVMVNFFPLFHTLLLFVTFPESLEQCTYSNLKNLYYLSWLLRTSYSHGFLLYYLPFIFTWETRSSFWVSDRRFDEVESPVNLFFIFVTGVFSFDHIHFVPYRDPHPQWLCSRGTNGLIRKTVCLLSIMTLVNMCWRNSVAAFRSKKQGMWLTRYRVMWVCICITYLVIYKIVSIWVFSLLLIISITPPMSSQTNP